RQQLAAIMLGVKIGKHQQAFVQDCAVVELQGRYLAARVERQEPRVRVTQRDLLLGHPAVEPGLAQHHPNDARIGRARGVEQLHCTASRFPAPSSDKLSTWKGRCPWRSGTS